MFFVRKDFRKDKKSVSQIFSIPTINQEKKVTIVLLKLTFFVINWCYKKDLRHAQMFI
jgi:hypothetical protein